MTYKEIQDLIKLVSKSELSEIRLKEGDFELTIRNKNYTKGASNNPSIIAPAMMPSIAAPQIAAAPAPAVVEEPAAQAAPASDTSEASDTSNLIEVKSPIVGTFYRSSSPDKPPFIQVGDKIQEGSVVCIVEAMKLFNEIESEVAGQVVKVMVEDASPIEYDQVLFLVDPNA